MPLRFPRFRAVLLATCLVAGVAAAPPPPAGPPATYADLAGLADAADLVVQVAVAKQIALPPERATNVAPGYTRLYIEAETRALLAGKAPLGESVRYLVDVPVDAKGKAPKLKKREFLLFARAVPGRCGLSRRGHHAAVAGRHRPASGRATPGAPLDALGRGHRGAGGGRGGHGRAHHGRGRADGRGAR